MTVTEKLQPTPLNKGRDRSDLDKPASSPSCVIYCRFSPRRNEDNCESNEIQLAYCEQHAVQKGYKVEGIFEDRAISGSIEDRPGMWKAIESLPQGGVFLVYKRDRIARNVYLEELVKRAVAERKGRIEAVQGDIPGDGPEQELVRQMMSAISQYERKIISIRTRWAMLDKQNRGQRMSRFAPYGWRLDPESENGMVEEPREYPVVEAVQTMYAAKLRPAEITRRLNTHFGELARGKNGFQQKTVQKIIDRIEFKVGRK